jgi:flagellar motor protein MotB
MAREQKHEEHQNHEAWAIPYADLITLLLAFFVVMYAISSVNEGKYRVLSDAMVSAFNGAPSAKSAPLPAPKDSSARGAASPGAIDILTRLAESLRSVPNPIRVEGHTDDRPINTRAFPSNWELSAARASSVVHLFSSRDIVPARLAVIGLGEYRPVKSNTTSEGRNANRRVVIVILSPDSRSDGAPEHGAQLMRPVTAPAAPH